MPPVFGGALKCPTCGKSVYFAEQVLGPGGVAYHKLCLKCVACGKILEPRLLGDHDGEAYCKACHGKYFGTKGYAAGGALVGEYVSRASASPTRPTTTGSTPASPARAPSFSAASGDLLTPSPRPASPLLSPRVSFSLSSFSASAIPSRVPATPERAEMNSTTGV
ncbi:SPOSA6832_02543 [Sporobolomyces salmonicolor]|uniref:SPOSA6832_02543-mRNA-1:cds n=1 Tax=Sporidiobolus salmonicolor TaxID=5005 RepID=A0A0D6ELT7_SPOSA|nr:SPOSA6832_02543 [Sporobolomyces salmonicolor]